MEKRLVLGALLLVALYVAYNEWRFRDYAHVAWDAQTAVCGVVPEHCDGGRK
jgi:hypothetical protein